MSIIKINAKRRMNFLIENQPHDDEWDCPYDELEYFILKAITQPVYVLEQDKFIENNLIKLSTYRKTKEIKEIAADLKQGFLIGDLINKYESQSRFKLEILLVLKDYIGYYNGAMFFGKLSVSDVLLQSLLFFIKEAEKEDYDPTFYNLASVWVELFDLDNNFLGDEELPEKGQGSVNIGWVKAKVKNKRDKELLLTFLYWNGEHFMSTEKKEVNYDIIDVIGWKEIDNNDEEDFLTFKRRNFIGSLGLLNIMEESKNLEEERLFDRKKAMYEFSILNRYKESRDF